MSKNNEWVSLPVFLSLGLLRTLAEKPIFGSSCIRMYSTVTYPYGVEMSRVKPGLSWLPHSRHISRNRE